MKETTEAEVLNSELLKGVLNAMGELNAVYYSNYDENSSSGSSPSNGAKKSPEHKPDIKVRRNEARSGSVMLIVLISVVAVVMLGSVIYTLDRRNTVYNKVSALNRQLNLAEAENVRLQSELESKMSAKNVEDYAEEVGMQKIDSSQIKYIKIQTDDVVNIPKQEEGIPAKIKNFFDRCVEYFRG